MTTLYAGLDAHTKTSTIVLLNEEGETVAEHEKFPTNQQQLINALDFPDRQVNVHLEASTICRTVVEMIQSTVNEVVVSDPRQNDLIDCTEGGDRTDAYQLARLLRLDEYNQIHQSWDPKIRDLRTALDEYRRVRKRQSQLKQDTKMFLQKTGLYREGDNDLTSSEGRKRLLNRAGRTMYREMLKNRFCELKFLGDQKETAKERMVRVGEEIPVFHRYQKVPGVGEYTATVFIAMIKSPFRFDRRSQVWKYCQLAVKNSTSDGTPKGGNHLNPAGHSVLKDAVCKMFHGAMRCKGENGIKRFYRVSFNENGQKHVARLNTMRKICDVLISMWKHSTEYDDDRIRHPNGS